MKYLKVIQKMLNKKTGTNKFTKKLRSIALLSAFFGLLKKNLRLILRSRSSAMIILLGPLIIIFLVGAAFNTSSLFNIKIGTYANSYSELSENLVKDLGDKQFQVIKLSSKDDCLLRLKDNDVHVCAIFPNDLKVGTTESVEFYVDNSKINLVWVIIDSISTKVSTKSAELTQQLAGNLLDTLTKTQSNLDKKRSTISSISEGNKNLETQFTGIATSLDALDLSFSVSKIGVDKIGSKLNGVITANKYNKSLFDDVTLAILASIKNARDYEKKVNNTIVLKQNLVDSIDGANKLLSQNTAGVKDIESTINLVNTDIGNAKSTSAETIASPIKISINPISVKNTHLNFLFPTLIVLIIMFIGLLLSSILVVREKLSNAYFRNFITPTSDVLFILTDYATNLIILLFQIIVIFSVGFYFFGQSLVDILFKSFILVFLLSTLFIFLGMLIGYLLKNEESVVLATFSLGSIFLFFSGTILPLETLPEYIKKIADFNPFVLGEGILKKIMLFNFGLSQLGYFLYILLGYIVVLMIAVYFARKLSKRAI